ncbi:hypothetical protein GCM10009789_21540 [Kribbella sancticallisti]|uniref:DUF4832 domain-containing protein n=1 Tax=Kribbella sancticallisti TaxID=460087 RepID=A0ABN2D042_9ACTN
MTDNRAEVLRTLRGTTSLKKFIDRLVEYGLTEKLTRQRLSKIEKGTAVFPPGLAAEIAETLIRSGVPPQQVEPLRVVRQPLIEPVPARTAAMRWKQWSRMVARVPNRRWWEQPLTVLSRMTSSEYAGAYRQLFERYGGDSEEVLHLLRRRLEIGGEGGPFHPVEGDAVGIRRAASTLRVCADRTDLFLLEVKLRNTGTVPWRDRLLFRLGTPVSASLPLTPAILPVPDTDPGGVCELIVPGRAQWFQNLAVVSYVMVFPDLSSCLPGRLPLWVDTRTEVYESTFDLPPGFPAAEIAD